MTPEQLTAIEARVAAATPGNLGAVGYDAKPYRYHTWRVENEEHYAIALNCTEEDAALFAAARQDLAALCAEVRRLQAEVQRLQSEAEHACDVGLPGLPPRDVDPQLYEDMELD